ncbi:flagellar motor protein [Psychromonas arctica]|uniref:Flagellar motor protein n=1 Tax=Psychromonas arctica TaxID=168275 RepID=A0ABU9H7V9_9GAMM
MSKIGLIGFVIIAVSIISAQLYHNAPLSGLLDFSAFLIVFGGTVGTILIQSSSKQLGHACKQLVCLFAKPRYQLEEQISLIKRWSVISRQDGLLSLEKENVENLDSFTEKSLSMLVDGCDPVTLQDILQQEIELEIDKNERGAQVFDAMGGYSPTIGIIGAVLGLIQAMAFLDQPELLGQGIAIAFVATIYGVAFANFIFLPIANKIRLNYQHQALFEEMSMVGIIAIAHGENSLLLERRLNGYLSRAAF